MSLVTFTLTSVFESAQRKRLTKPVSTVPRPYLCVPSSFYAFLAPLHEAKIGVLNLQRMNEYSVTLENPLNLARHGSKEIIHRL